MKKRVLIIKTSSLGDVLHTLPAVTDAAQQLPDIRFDWVVEEAFAEVPAWHAAVEQVIPVAVRRWRKRPVHALRSGEPQAAIRQIRKPDYAHVIDAQGLLKSAVITRFARGPRLGLDRSSAREPLAAYAYQQKIHIPRDLHAVQRVRGLFAAALGYEMPASGPDYGIREKFSGSESRPYLVFLHGTTWPSKHWPKEYWHRLGELALQQGLKVKLPWGNEDERRRALEIASVGDSIEVLPQMGLGELAGILAGARAVVGVDTGLVHLAAALATPCLTLYGSTDPGLTGTVGDSQYHLQAEFSCAPCLEKKCTYAGKAPVYPACYQTIGPDAVWSRLERMLSGSPLQGRSAAHE